MESFCCLSLCLCLSSRGQTFPALELDQHEHQADAAKEARASPSRLRARIDMLSQGAGRAASVSAAVRGLCPRGAVE